MLALGLLEADLVGDLDHSGGKILVKNSTMLGVVVIVGHLDGTLEVDEAAASTALGLVALGLGLSIAAKVALGLRASRGLAAGPCALGGRAGGAAVGDRGSADSLALGRHAHILAQRATRGLAVLA